MKKLLLTFVAIFAATCASFAGDGTKENPYTAAEVIAFDPMDGTVTAWVKAYIVGSATGSKADTYVPGAPENASGTNIFIADSQSETDYTKCVPVQLPKGDLRDALNLASTKTNLGKTLLINAQLNKYFGVAGLKSPTEYELTGETTYKEETSGGEEGGENESWTYIFTKVTSIRSGEKYILAANVDGVMKVAQNLAETKTYGYLNVDDAKEVNGTITLDSKDNVYTLKGSNIIDRFGRLLYQTGTYNSFNVAADAAEGIDWTISFNEDGTAKIMNDDVQKYMQFSTSYSSYGSYAEPQDGAVLPSIYMLTDSTTAQHQDTPMSKISDVVAAETNGKYKVQGTVVAACASGALLSDGTGFIYYYNKANALAVGDQVTMEGNTTTYNGFKQFTDAATIEKTGTTTVNYPEAVNINLDEWAAAPVIQYVKMSGTLAISGNYYNVTVDGATAIGSLVYPTDAQKEQLTDGDITVYGYAIYTSSQNKYVNIIVTSIGSEQHQDETPLSKIGDVVSAEENGKFKVQGTVVAACASGALLGDGTGFIYYYNKANTLAIGDEVTMEGATTTYNGFKQFTDAAVIEKTGTTTVEYPEAVNINLDEWAAAPVIEYVKMSGTLAISGNYYNVTVDGATAIGSLVYPTDAQKEQLSDGPITVYGYAIYTSSKNKYVNVIVTSIEAAASLDVNITDFVPAETFEEDGTYQVTAKYTVTGAEDLMIPDLIFTYELIDVTGAVVASGEKNAMDINDGFVNFYFNNLEAAKDYKLTIKKITIFDYANIDYETFETPASLEKEGDLGSIQFTTPAKLDVVITKLTPDNAIDAEDNSFKVVLDFTTIGAESLMIPDLIFTYQVMDVTGAIVAGGEKNPSDIAAGTVNLYVEGLEVGKTYTLTVTKITVYDYANMDYETFETPASLVKEGNLASVEFSVNPTGIETIETQKTGRIFSISGMEMRKMQKGLNIVDGKTILVK